MNNRKKANTRNKSESQHTVKRLLKNLDYMEFVEILDDKTLVRKKYSREIRQVNFL